MSDLISRQNAIDAFGLSEKTRKYGGDHSGYDTMMLYEIQDVLESLPSAQPKIIRCKDCKHWHREIYNGIEYVNFNWCDLNHYGDGHNFYCADAERRTNWCDLNHDG